MKLTLISDINNKKLTEAIQVDEENKEINEEETSNVATDTVDVEEIINSSNLLEPDQNITPESPDAEETTDVDNNVDNNQLNKGLEMEIKALIDSFWDLRSNILYISENFTDLGKVKNILLELADDATISIGMLYKVSNLINPELSLLINKGENKASEQILNNEE